MKTINLKGLFLRSCAALFLAFFFWSCSNETEITATQENANVKEGYKLLVKTDKFTCYTPSSATKALDYQLLNVYDLPSIDIYFSENDDQASRNIYSNKSIFKQDGKVICTLLTNLEKVDNGYILNYKKEGGEPGSVLLPNHITKGRGQDTMNCISDAYTNHGWVSVWVTVQSAFLPQTAVAIAAACAVRNF